MTDSRSPIADFYPTDFRIDQEGTRNEWEGVVLVPFVDKARLLQVRGCTRVTAWGPVEQLHPTLLKYTNLAFHVGSWAHTGTQSSANGSKG